MTVELYYEKGSDKKREALSWNGEYNLVFGNASQQ